MHERDIKSSVHYKVLELNNEVVQKKKKSLMKSCFYSYIIKIGFFVYILFKNTKV